MTQQLIYRNNNHLLCPYCDKPVYMGYTSKRDSELCMCRNIPEIVVYDSTKPIKKIEPLSNYFEYKKTPKKGLFILVAAKIKRWLL